MPRFYRLLFWALALPFGAAAQGLGVGTTTPHTSAALDITATDKGMLVPRLTTAQRTAISTPAVGLLVYQTNGTPGFYYYDGTQWLQLPTGQVPDAQGLIAGADANGATMVGTLAGNGTVGYQDGVGTAARFSQPRALAVDAAGNCYVADYANHRIRKILSDGTVTTLAGSGTAGFLDGPGTSARFNSPAGVAVDSAGYVYVADSFNRRIRKITPGGVVSTLAGSGTNGFLDGSGTSAQFGLLNTLVLGRGAVVYVADATNHAIRKVLPNGTVSTVAGNGTSGYQDGVGAAARFASPNGICLDSAGTLYVADYSNQRIRKILPNGTVSTLAGSGTQGFLEGPALTARLSNPTGVVMAPDGTLYIADGGNARVRKLSTNGIVSTVAGISAGGYVDGNGAIAQFNVPIGITQAADGALLVSDVNNACVRRISFRGYALGNQQLSKTGTTISLTNGGSVTDSDNQQLTKVGSTIGLTNGGTVTDSDNQQLTKTGSTISLTNGGTITDDDSQTLAVAGGALSISNGNTVPLTSIDAQQLTKSGSTISLTNGGSVTDADNQNLSLSGAGLSISGGTGVTLPDASATNELQTISKTGSTVTLSNGGGTFTDADNQTLSIVGSTISLSNGGSVTVPSSADNLGNHTATQNLNLGTSQLVGNGGTSGLSVSSTGQIGIATTAPAARLDILGGADADGTDDPYALAFQYRLGGFRHWIRSRHNNVTTAGDNALEFFLNSSATAVGSSAPGTGNTQVLTLESYAGAPRAGIGTANPAGLLHLSGAETTANGNAAALRVENTAATTANAWMLRAGGNGTNTPDGGFSIADNNFYRFVITSTGQTGVATLAPHSTLHVNGTLAVGTRTGLAGGTAAAPTDLDATNASYFGVSPANGTNNVYRLPNPANCAGRMYVIRNNSGSVAAVLTTASGSLFAGSGGTALTSYTLNPTTAVKTVIIFSDGQNWTVGQLN